MDQPSGGIRPGVRQQAEGTVGSVLGQLVEQELAKEREHATELRERALRLITAVGALVALIFAFVALIPKDRTKIPAQAFGWLTFAVIVFVASGIVYLLPLGSPILKVPFFPALKPLLTIQRSHDEEAYIDVGTWLGDWNEPAGRPLGRGPAASEVIATAQAHMLKDLQRRNKYVFWFVAGAVFADLVALAALAFAITQVLEAARR